MGRLAFITLTLIFFISTPSPGGEFCEGGPEWDDYGPLCYENMKRLCDPRFGGAEDPQCQVYFAGRPPDYPDNPAAVGGNEFDTLGSNGSASQTDVLNSINDLNAAENALENFPGTWSGVAIAPDGTRFANVYSAGSKSLAETVLRFRCGPDCKSYFVNNGCVAVAYNSKRHAYGFGWADNLLFAKLQSKAACGKKCQVKGWACY